MREDLEAALALNTRMQSWAHVARTQLALGQTLLLRGAEEHGDEAWAQALCKEARERQTVKVFTL